MVLQHKCANATNLFTAVGAKLCPIGEIPCKSGNKCIAEHKLCDSVNDCEDGSDEKLNECSPLPDQKFTGSYAPSIVDTSSNSRSKGEQDPNSNSHRNEVDNYPPGTNYLPHHHDEDGSRARNTYSPSPSSYHPQPSGKLISLSPLLIRFETRISSYSFLVLLLFLHRANFILYGQGISNMISLLPSCCFIAK